MKVFVVIVALMAVAAASPLARNAKVSDAEIAIIVAAIQSPSTDPATAAILEAQLQAILAGGNPIAISPVVIDPTPAIVDNVEPIAVGPAIIDQLAPIAVGPAIVDFPVEVAPSPVIVAPSPVVVEPVPVLNPKPTPPAAVVEPSPVATLPDSAAVSTVSASLVQIILNINQAATTPVVPPAVAEAPIAVDPVTVVDHVPVDPSPVIVAPAPVDPVVVVDQPSIIPDPVVLPTPVLPEVVPEPVVLPAPVLPEIIPAPVVLPSPVLPEPVVIPEAVITLPEELN
ncbi:calphotin-like [Plodia interpunctella]|uniref:calphotin-like n=1 Tax=Plodia interpunctella TaxID=58824 RepID=UPI002368EBC5|nr:calphotin-like [Plodia interpunctella]